MEAAAPLLLLMGSRVEHVGGPGAGAAAKVANNLALGVAMAGLSEALALGVAMGLDAAVLARLLNASTARCWAGEVNNPIPVSRGGVEGWGGGGGSGGYGEPAATVPRGGGYLKPYYTLPTKPLID